MTAQPPFTSAAARARWDAYFAKVDQLLAQARLTGTGLADDLRDHLGESFLAEPGEREVPRLEAAIRKLGEPADYLRPMLAEALLDHGARSGNPLTIARGLWHALLTGTRTAVLGTVFALGYALIAVFLAMALLKPFLFRNVGLIRHLDGTLSFGIVPYEGGGVELLGWWTIPLALAGAAVLYGALTLLLRLLRRG